MIVVDIQAAQSLSSGHRGIGRYTRELAAALVRRHGEVVDAFCWNADLPADTSLGDIVPAELLVSSADLAGTSIDLLHVCSPFEPVPMHTLLPPAQVRGLVATCYDLIPYRFQQHYLSGQPRADYLARLGFLLGCDAIVTDSASAAKDCVELLGVPADRLTVIGGGTNDLFAPATSPLAERMTTLRATIPGLRAGFVLVPTGMDWRKNTEGAIAAYARLPAALQARHQLVVACRVTEHERRWMAEHIRANAVVGEVLITGFVGDEDLARLYQSAEVVLFPSKYEGFGLPVLEARRCGARVICSNVSSLPEVMPMAAATFNPWQVEEIAAVLLRALTDAGFAAQLDAAADPGFTFDLAADRLVEVYAAVEHKVRRRRRRLAVVSLLPAPNVLDTDRTALLDALHDHVDVTCYVPDDIFPPNLEPRRFPVHRLDRLAADALGGRFDAVLYCVGGSDGHRPLLSALARVRGHVLFDDVDLTACYRAAERRTIAARWYRDGDTPRFAAPAAATAVQCLVATQFAADALAADTGVTATVVGGAGPRPVDSLQSGGAVHVVSLGAAGDERRSATFVAATELVLARHPRWRASLVGDGSSRFVDPDSAVAAVEPPRTDGLAVWFERATLLVQLRAEGSGRPSPVVARAMASGVPVIVAGVGAEAELPDDAVVKVPEDVSADELAEAIEGLLADPDGAVAIATAGLRYAAAHTSAEQARRIADAVFAAPLGRIAPVRRAGPAPLATAGGTRPAG
jgi:glycosyltransferase involved in cell wall biosynthesis